MHDAFDRWTIYIYHGHDEMKGVSFFSKFHSLVLFIHGGMPTRKLGIGNDWMKGVFFFIYFWNFNEVEELLPALVTLQHFYVLCKHYKQIRVRYMGFSPYAGLCHSQPLQICGPAHLPAQKILKKYFFQYYKQKKLNKQKLIFLLSQKKNM